MSLSDAKVKAKEMGIKVGKMKLPELIQTIQKAEGNIPCFQSRPDNCDQKKCLWWDDCVSRR